MNYHAEMEKCISSSSFPCKTWSLFNLWAPIWCWCCWRPLPQGLSEDSWRQMAKKNSWYVFLHNSLLHFALCASPIEALFVPSSINFKKFLCGGNTRTSTETHSLSPSSRHQWWYSQTSKKTTSLAAENLKKFLIPLHLYRGCNYFH